MEGRKLFVRMVLSCLAVVIFAGSPDVNSQTNPANPIPQFLLKTFSKGVILMKDGRQLAATVNYNIVDEEMIFLQNGTYMALENPQEIDTVFIQKMKFVPVDKAFYEVVSKGPVVIYIQHKGKYTPVGSPTAYGMTSKTLGPTKVLTMRAGNQVRQIELPDNVEVTPATVNWVQKNKEMIKFTGEKQFLKIFPEYEGKLKEFIKTNKIDIKSPEDLARLGNFCNSITK